MKKKYIISAIVVVIAAALCIWLFTRPERLGNVVVNHTNAEPESSVSTITFLGEVGDTIKFSFESNIESGDLDIIVYDSKGNVVKKLDKARNLETFETLDYSDTYTLAAEYKDFIGNFNVRINKVE